MKALQFLTDPEPWPEELPDDAPQLLKNLSTTPMALVDLPDPEPLADDWLVVDTRLTGICGSDSKQVLMDFGDAGDNMMTGTPAGVSNMHHGDKIESGNAEALELQNKIK